MLLKYIHLLLCLTLTSSLVSAPLTLQAITCNQALKRLNSPPPKINFSLFQKSLTKNLEKNCRGQVCTSQELTKSTFKSLQESLGNKAKSFRAYSAILSIMVGTSAFAAVISSQVGTHYPSMTYFISIFLGSLTSLGIYVVGAPILEPLQSRIRASAYKLMEEKKRTGSFLEEQFYRTNQILTTNEQWSRSVYRDYLRSLSGTLYEIRRSLKERDNEYASHLLAEISTRLTTLFPDINPTDPIIQKTVHSIFFKSSTRLLSQKEDFISSTLEKIENIKKEMDKPPQKDFRATLENWLQEL